MKEANVNVLIQQTDKNLIIKGLSEELIPFAEYTNQHLQDDYRIIISENTGDDPRYSIITVPINYPHYLDPVTVFDNTYCALSKSPRVMIIQHESPAKAYALQIEGIKLFYYPPDIQEE